MNRLLSMLLGISLVAHGAFSMPSPEGNANEEQKRETVKQYIATAKSYDKRLRKEAALVAAAKRYITFLGQFGAHEQGDIFEYMESLFADDCKKVVNGRVVTHDRNELYVQMAKAKDVLGTWSVSVMHPIAIDLSTNSAVIHCEIPTQEAGTIVVMKFLTIDNGYITEINEVYNALDTVVESLHKITE